MNKQLEISEHIREVFMPYAMTTIMDRALPNVADGLKPVHRKILYAMDNKGITYKREDRAKSTEPVAETMKIHGHGDASIYEALALLTEQNESLLHPFLDGEGAFGKVYSKDSPSASRYTFCRLNKFTNDTMFCGLDKGVVDFVEEGGHKQPLELPCSFPNILVKPNIGIAVGFACNFPSFNLNEVCDSAIAVLRNQEDEVYNTIKAPDFSTGGDYVLNTTELKKVIDSGRGAFKLRAKYRYIKEQNLIEIYEVPYGVTCDAIVDKVGDIIRLKKHKEILDIRDETGWSIEDNCEKLKITIDIAKKANPEIIMEYLFKNTPLESNFNVNMNSLYKNSPKVRGVKETLRDWCDFRKETVKKELTYDLDKLRKEYKLLIGLTKIIDHIDEVISLIRNAETDEDVISSLMSAFGLDETQAEYVSNIKLKNLNKKWIESKTSRTQEVAKKGKELSSTIEDEVKLSEVIITQLEDIKKEYGKERKTTIITQSNTVTISKEDLIEDYNCYVTLTAEGYIKKTKLSSDMQKTKDGDYVTQQISATNKSNILLFTDKGNVFTLKGYDLKLLTPSVLGTYIPTLISLDSDENVIYMVCTTDFKGNMIFGFENGKVAKVKLSAYNKNRQKLQNSYYMGSKLVCISLEQEGLMFAQSSIDKVIIFNPKDIAEKESRTAQGVMVIKSRKNSYMKAMDYIRKDLSQEAIDYYKVSLNSVGKNLKKEHGSLS